MKWLYISLLFLSAVFVMGAYVLCSRKQKIVSDLSNSRNILKRLFSTAALAVVFDAIALMMSSEKAALFMYGIHNIFLDSMLMALIVFIHRYTGIKSKIEHLDMVVGFFALIDSVTLLLNPFLKFSFRVKQVTDPFDKTFYIISERRLVYFVHAVFLIGSAAICILLLSRKIANCPAIYIPKFASILILILFIFLTHIAFTYFTYNIDYSLLMYAPIAFAMYYFSMVYVPRGLIERLLLFTVANMKDGIICLDVEGKCVHANRPAKEYCDAIHDPTAIESQIDTWFRDNINEDKADAAWQSKRKIEGERRCYDIEYKQIFDYKGKYLGCFFVLHDRTEEFSRLEAEKYRASHDSLTGIFNKEHFCEEAQKCIKANLDTKFYVVCTDVKNFKLINDLFGVETGDELLKYIAQTIFESVGKQTVIGRLTGDRFAMLLHRGQFSEKLLNDQAEKISKFIDHSVFKVHIQYGIYEINDPNIRVSVMCDRANLAIKTIKDSYQSNIAYYDKRLRESFLNEQKVISEFDNALKTCQFHAYIQPQITVDGRILGGEALVRWEHPEEGMVPPYKFIGVFEQTGLISQLDTYMWEAACKQLRKWRDAGLKNNYISVNISQKDFYLINVYETLTALVKKYDLPPKCLHLEITETAIMNNPAAQLPLIEKLRDFGFIVEIDDFGSGYSSLNTLKDLKVDVLKIDMGFLTKTEHEERSMTILKMVISLAKSLDMEVITEGVETKEQVDFLTDYGCDMFQGYFFAKPMKTSDFEDKYLHLKTGA